MLTDGRVIPPGATQMFDVAPAPSEVGRSPLPSKRVMA